MNYQETIAWMFEQLPMYQQKGAIAYKNDLTNILLFSKHLGFPEKNLKTIHVAGTNGKGSTSSMIASILQESGFKVGLYTSPHLKDYRERIKINGQYIEEHFVVDFINKNLVFLTKNKLSFFEMSVGLALEYFKKQEVDFAVIEVGLGGRLDATNIIKPLISVITSIGLDHVEFLGNTLEKIAFEKAGIIKQNTPVVIGETLPETLEVFKTVAKRNDSEIYWSEESKTPDYKTDLNGDYQKQNSRTARTAIEVLKNIYNVNVSEKNIKNGFIKTIQNTGLKGRWEIISTDPLTITDAAHNKHGLESVLKQLKNLNKRNYHFVLGFLKEKDLNTILPLFPVNANYYFTKPNNLRALDENNLKMLAKNFKLIGDCYNNVTDALIAAQKNAKDTDCIYIGGSTFIVAEIL
jgi:dihydrofolate synthase/folylpolyglutamate synthase